MMARLPMGIRISGLPLMLALCFLAVACNQPEVPYSDLTAPPSVVFDKGTVVVRMAPLRESPPTYVEPRIRFEDEGIKISGTVIYTKSAKTRVKIPEKYADRHKWKAYWIDPDGSRRLLTIGDEPDYGSEE